MAKDLKHGYEAESQTFAGSCSFSDYQGGPDSEKRNTLAFLAAQCIGRPNHILMIGSWGSSKELPD